MSWFQNQNGCGLRGSLGDVMLRKGGFKNLGNRETLSNPPLDRHVSSDNIQVIENDFLVPESSISWTDQAIKDIIIGNNSVINR